MTMLLSSWRKLWQFAISVHNDSAVVELHHYWLLVFNPSSMNLVGFSNSLLMIFFILLTCVLAYMRDREETLAFDKSVNITNLL